MATQSQYVARIASTSASSSISAEARGSLAERAGQRHRRPHGGTMAAASLPRWFTSYKSGSASGCAVMADTLAGSSDSLTDHARGGVRVSIVGDDLAGGCG